MNKFLANSGICSRREADELIVAGAVMVNGIVVTELGTKILPTDKVQYGDDNVRREKLVYVLLNKPKGYMTTTDDPFDRNTVMSLVADAGRERILSEFTVEHLADRVTQAYVSQCAAQVGKDYLEH